MNSRISPIFIHISACLIFLSLPILFAPNTSNFLSGFTNPPVQRDFLFFTLLIGIFYCHYYWLIPTFYFKQRHLLFVGAGLLLFIIIWICPNLIIPQEGRVNPRKSYYGHEKASLFLDISHRFFLYLAALFFAFALKFNARWKKTEKEKLHTELSYLKAQINPHFFFNTLNGIYALSLKKSDHTPDVIAQLAGIMRYVLYEAGKDKVPLEKEIAYIRDYVTLQGTRFDSSIPITFTVQGDPKGKKIAPLVIMSFIENAFKHGVNAAEDSSIKIFMDIRTDELDLEVKNNKVTSRQIKIESSGLGIRNTRRRLDLLYPGAYTLHIHNNAHDFLVFLNIQLK